MKPARHPTALRTQKLLIDAGLATQVVEFDQPTRTCAEAAAACFSASNREAILALNNKTAVTSP